ncbi:hypothetical protein ASPZODRAFT_128670 [Penicilliopsis zonata CBS 506.65]|uniref:Zn(2)-C6 fungal-type domain-containing protein n=1 Tax=Penicilliopsis zonata CBS 506.65 TaxID=1073090 RepID=A0A1L9SS79_9EURO|nr:hypothetical protein ASPZODRAFT_128670 [Penicilliopsis zonata CBS 506.65]OJJ50065.1 hypothetical protein ASPZODRAFT_128670 [Penicilliopsis zonata CBS 506.65]
MSALSPKRNSAASSTVPPPRQIRFVSNDGQPQTKRRRINAACRTCRKRKIRCSGEQPVCKTCSDCGQSCLGYNEPGGFHQQLLRTHSDVDSHPPTATVPREDHASTSAPKIPQIRSPDTPQIVSPRAPAPSRLETAKPSSPLLDIVAIPPGRVKRELELQAAGESPESSRTSLSSTNRTHVPYFRYFGPTAIVPGFKQMVVQVRGSRKSNPSISSDSLSPLRSPKFPETGVGSLAALADARDTNSIPFYDRDDALPVGNLVTHLCELFFVHLGCSFPFLQQERFLRDLKDKRVDTMLVDSVCALAARFSPHPLLSPLQAQSIEGTEPQPETSNRSDRGQPFAHRAMSALVDALSCPTLSVVQACLLLAYEEFGSNHDSGLWMYLGISIRMAQDLGLQKLQGLRYNYGAFGLTPSAVQTGHAGKLRDDQFEEAQVRKDSDSSQATGSADEIATERERVDSFWSIFFLDRVISSGTGRPVTLRDEDIELCFPLQSDSQLANTWPAPFPPLIRIIHLYGRVTDLINGIQDVNHVTPDTLKLLAGMESDLTGIYQRLSPKLHFNAANFQTYVKAKEGTNFILLHFWFHTLIVLLHQPTLLNSFGGTIQQLYPNSRELSMSSAKTIADILSFSELIDGKSFIGNPFTSQPMYIAACAFLMESAYYSSPSSRSGSPPAQSLLTNQSSGFVMPNLTHASERKSTAKHILLASAAKENYQRCYKALKALETYWEGTKYILTVLDQKAKGIMDPLLYTAEEMESTSEISPIPRNSTSDVAPSIPGAAETPTSGRLSPRIDAGQAIGWALTGATNSSQPNLSLLYQMPAIQPEYSNNGYLEVPNQPRGSNPSPSYPQPLQPVRPSHPSRGSSFTTAAGPSLFPSHPTGSVAPSDPNVLLGLNTSSYQHPTSRTPSDSQSSFHLPQSQMNRSATAAYNYPLASPAVEQPTSSHMDLRGDVLIECQDIDMATLHQQNSLPFSITGEVLPWLEYLPQDVLSYFGDHTFPLMNPDDGEHQPPP